jgi:hypothetical protein
VGQYFPTHQNFDFSHHLGFPQKKISMKHEQKLYLYNTEEKYKKD